MDPFTFAMLVSSGIQIFGQIKANEAEAEANETNAEFFREQQKISASATRREVDIFDRESEAFFGDQVSAYAKAGVDLSGSILASLTQTKQAIRGERSAILEQGKLRTKLAGMKASESEKSADRARDSNFFDAITTIAATGSAITGRSGKTASATSDSDVFFSGSNKAAKSTFGLDFNLGR